jgi:hypothetical protein
MKLFRHTYKRRAALVTLLVHVLLVGVFYSFGLTYMDPKIEEGIAIEFGYVEEGFGEEITQTEEIQTEIIEEVLETEAAAPIEEPTVSEEIITQDIEEAPALVEEIEQEQMEEPVSVKEEEKPQASTELQQALSSLFQSTETTPSGSADEEGVQGDESGSVVGEKEAIGGEGNTADGYELGDRQAILKPKPNYSCNETGTVVIRVWVNSEGVTYKSELDLKNTTDTSPCLVREAKAAALKTTWLADANAQATQIGYIIYNFRKQ